MQPDAETKVVEYFIHSGIIMLCLNCMKTNSQVDKPKAALAVSILYQIVKSKDGLEYVCQSYDVFMGVFTILVSLMNLQFLLHKQ